VYSLSAAEWGRLVNALNAMKASGAYDDFTRRHVTAMMTATLYPGETGTSRNAAHRGPIFLPWHRQALRELELELRTYDTGSPALEWPYWSWEGEGKTYPTGPAWWSTRIWSLVGGNGVSANGYRIADGPFAGWTSVVYNSSTKTFTARAGITRQFNTSSGPMPTVSLSPTKYDASPWSEHTSSSASFRRRLELAHNRVHLLVRGDMAAGTAPNDPLFWLHHCNCDRIWARWQKLRGERNYQPGSGGPPGHNLNDVMQFLRMTGRTPSNTLSCAALGYEYDRLDG